MSNWNRSVENNRRQEEYAQNLRLMRHELQSVFADKHREVHTECGYAKIEELTPEDYQRMYDCDPISARVIELYPSECWQVCPDIYEEEDIETETAFEKALDEIGRSLANIGSYEGQEGSPLWNYLERADILSGIGSYGVILLGINSGKLEEPLKLQELTVQAKTETKETPLGKGKTKTESTTTVNIAVAPDSPKVSATKLLFLRVLSQKEAPIASWVNDPNDARFGQPEFYNVTISGDHASSTSVPGGDQSQASRTYRVHWSRIIHLADNKASNEVLGVPRCQRVYHRLYDLQKLYGGSAEMYWQGAFNGISFELMPAMAGVKITDAQKADMRRSMEARRTGLQRDLILPGLHANSIAPQVSDPTPQIERQIEAICIYLGCPKRIFMGSERGELSSNQDTRAWYSRVRKRLNRYVTPQIIVPFINRLIQVGVLPVPKTYCVHWSDVSSVTDLEKAQIGLARMQSLKEYMTGQVAELMTPIDAYTFIGVDEEQAKQFVENKVKEISDFENGEGDETSLDVHAREDALREEEQARADEHRAEDMERADFNADADRKLAQDQIKAKGAAGK